MNYEQFCPQTWGNSSEGSLSKSQLCVLNCLLSESREIVVVDEIGLILKARHDSIHRIGDLY
ncbi:hypothetical protein HI914_01188 [Erysiphe necator]|nr:hypothetical protein HI914_01188 [Erysiphe necator]